MPSPIGHALGAAAAGWALDRERPTVRRTALLVAVGLAPDLDLLFGTHSTYTHSVGAVAIVTLIAWLATRDARLTAAVAAAWASHLLLDWLGSDSRDPIGIMVLWPFSTAHYQSGFYVFDAISRRYWMPEQFIWGNLKAAAREVAILLPVLGAAYYWVSTKVTKDTKVTKRNSVP